VLDAEHHVLLYLLGFSQVPGLEHDVEEVLTEFIVDIFVPDHLFDKFIFELAFAEEFLHEVSEFSCLTFGQDEELLFYEVHDHFTPALDQFALGVFDVDYFLQNVNDFDFELLIFYQDYCQFLVILVHFEHLDREILVLIVTANLVEFVHVYFLPDEVILQNGCEGVSVVDGHQVVD